MRRSQEKYFLVFVVVAMLCLANYAGYAQNDCATATTLTVGTQCVATTMNSTNSTNSNPGAGCGIQNRDDAWATFQATATITVIEYQPTTEDAILHVFSGSCGSLVQEGCADAYWGGFSEVVVINTTVSDWYYIRIQRYQSNGNMNGEVCVWSNIPANETCAGAVSIDVNGACLTNRLHGTSGEGLADASCPTNGTNELNEASSWYSFVAPNNGTVDITATITSADSYQFPIEVMDACGGAVVDCEYTFNGSAMTNNVKLLTPCNTYYINIAYPIPDQFRLAGGPLEPTYDLCITSAGAVLCLPAGDAYGVHSPDALGGSVTTCEISATAGTGAIDGLVYANGGEVGTSVSISNYPVITAENINCLDTDIDFTTTDPTPNWTDLGANETAAMPDATATISNNQYTATLGRRDIDFTGDVSTYGNVNFINENFSSCAAPAGWSSFIGAGQAMTLYSATQVAWCNDAGFTVDGTCALIMDDDCYGGPGWDQNYTFTNAQDMSTCSSGLLEFDYYLSQYAGGSNGIFTVGIWDGAAWNIEISTTTNGAASASIDVTPYLNNGLLVVFDYSSGFAWDNGVVIDNVVLSGTNCFTGTSTQAITYNDFVNISMDIPTAGTPTGATPICSGTTGNYASPDAGTLGYSYLWTAPTIGTQAAPVIGTATASSTDITFSNVSGSDIVYTVYLDIISECCGPLGQVSKAVTVNSIPLPDPLVLDAAPSVCAGGTATLSVNSPDASFSYEWYLASTGGSAIATGSGYDATATTTPTTYYVEAVTSNGCRSTPRVSVVLTGTDTPPTVPNPGAGCGPGLFTATVTSPVSSATYSWYSAPGPPPSGLLQTGLTTSYDINASSTPTLVYVTETAPGCDASSATIVTVTYTGTISVDWDGSTSTDWFTASNWTPACVPDAGIDVTIPSGVINNCDIQFANGGDANCKSITIDPAATLSMSDTKAVLNVHGDWTNNGIFTPVMGVVEFTGSAAQAILGSVTLFYDLNINKSSGTVTMGVDLVVASNLNLLDGELAIGTDNKITITNASNSAVGNVNGYLVSEGQTSFLEWYTDATANTYIFPFGVSGSHIPFTFQKNTAVATNIVIATWNTSPDNQTMLPVGTTLSAAKGVSQLIDRWWEITPSVALPADLTFRWTTSETSSVNYTGDPMSYHWNSTGWDDISGSAGLESITATWTSYSGGGGGGGPLPLDLWYFDAEHNAATGNVDLSWATVSETNSEFFTVEKSRGGKDFEFVATVPGAGTSKQSVNYSAVDEYPYMGLSYYRLKRTDFDDECKYSQLVPVTIMENLQFSVWPNPAKDKLEITFGNASKGTILPMSPENSAEINIYDSNGRVVYSKVFDGTFYKFNIDISAFDHGMYIVTLNANNDLHTAKFVKE